MRVVVVGGGIAGLAAAHRLRELSAGMEIIVVEQAAYLGGKIRTASIAGRVLETGAESFLVRDEDSPAQRLAQRVGLGGSLVHPAAVPAAVSTQGGMRAIPPGTLLGVPTKASTLEGIATVADLDQDAGKPLLRRGEDVPVGLLVRARFGDEVVDRLVEPMLGGVYAGWADRLSLAATMPGLHAAAQAHPTLSAAVASVLAASPRPPGTAVFATVAGGLSRLVTAVASATNARVMLGQPVRELTRTSTGWRLVLGSAHESSARTPSGREPASSGELSADAVVLAVPAAPASRLLAGLDASAAALVGALDYASVVVVTLALPADTELPRLSGFLVPAERGVAVKAATFLSTKWPHLRDAEAHTCAGSTITPPSATPTPAASRPDAPVLVRASVGRYREEADLQRPDHELAALIHTELGDLLGDGGTRRALPAPVATMVSRWGGALPQYGVGHVARVAAARAMLAPTVALAGAAFDGVGIAACVRSGEAAAEAVWATLSGLEQ